MKRIAKQNEQLSKRAATETNKEIFPILNGLKCHVLHANFGNTRHGIFLNLVERLDGKLVPLTNCEEGLYVIVEENVIEEQLRKLLEWAELPCVTTFVHCNWLSACMKAKSKVDVAEYIVCKKSNLSLVINAFQEKTDLSAKLEMKDKEEITEEGTNKNEFNMKFNNFEDQNNAVNISAENNIIDDLQKNQNISIFTSYKPEYTLQDKFACSRPSTSCKLENVNQHITQELDKLSTAYQCQKDTWRALGYQRAISAIKNYPREIKSREEARQIPGVGERLADKVFEIIESGSLRKVEEVCESEQTKAITLFMGVWGAGPAAAQAWYTQGFRTLEDLREKASLTRNQQIGLKLYEDINDKIPRSEVAEIEECVRRASDGLVSGVLMEVCGSYRRGRNFCGDVDILITHPDGISHQGALRHLLHHLHESGFLTDDLVSESNGDQVKYLGVCRLPGDNRKHRRLDIIVVPFAEFAPALMYFTGSAHFNRSMRLLATKMGMSLSEHGLRAGVVRLAGSKVTEGHLLETPDEISIFKLLGLEFRPPNERDH